MINTLRSGEVFNANEYSERNILIVGLGAIGSKVLENLVCAGLTNLTACDYDTVEDHNLGNQLFTQTHIGGSKVEGCRRWVTSKAGSDVTLKMNWLDKKLDGRDTHLVGSPDIMISCVDTFDARRMLLGLAQDTWCDMFIEAGMATGHGTMFMVDPSDKAGCDAWSSTLGDDDDPSYEVSACGSGLTVGVTASLIAGMMSWSVMNYLKTGYVEPKLRLDTAPFMISKIDQR